MFHVKRVAVEVPTFMESGRQACLGADDEIFYPSRYTIEKVYRAKQMCRSCEFLQECGVWAIRSREEHGVWGSLTPLERSKIREDLGLEP